ncbi:MAG: PAS domain-containing protein, partial [Cyanobacteria bacterium P01_H01_bin.121]
MSGQDHELEPLVEQLRTTLGTMEAALGAIADAIVWTNAENRVQWCNAAFDRLVNRPPLAILDQDLSDLLPLWQHDQPVAPQEYPSLRILQETGRSQHETEYTLQQGSQTRVLRVSSNRIQLEANAPVAMLVMRDITTSQQQVSAQAQRANALQRLVEGTA